MTDHFGTISMKWDPKNLEIRTMSVEKTLEPLVLQVTTLVNTKGPSKKKKGRSKRAHVLVAAVEKATENFIEKGEQIAYENPDIKQEMLSAVEEVRKTGETMSFAAREFAEDPCSSLKRGNMVRAARNLLSAVTRLLILADMVDVHLLLKSLRVLEDDLEKVKNASNQRDLMENIDLFGRSASDLMTQAAKRQQELKDPQLRDDLAAARAILKKHSTMLLTASKVYVRHPELAAAKENRDYVLKQVCEAINTISDVAQGKIPPQNMLENAYEGPGELAAALDDFDERMVMEPLAYNEVRTRLSLEERLESIISGAALMADSSCTRDERRERIVTECNAVRQALQDLLSEYMANQVQLQRGGKRMSVKETSEGLERAIDNMCKKTKDLRRQLRKAVVDHVSDSFLETSVPLLVLIEAATAGNEKEVEECAVVFKEHANKLVEVANLACSMSSHEDGVKMVRYAAAQIDNLCPQVINAARILASKPKSRVALENMEVFRAAWENQVRVLTEAVDDITTIDDFLAVSENHILDDVNKCVLSLQEGYADTLDRTAGAIRGRAARVCNVVTAEMDNYEPGIYTERVLEAIKVLRDQVMPNFAQRVQVAVDALSSNPPKDVDENEFIDASRLVYDGVREIRRAVLMNRTDEELDPEEIEDEDQYTVETRSRSSAHTGDHGIDEYPDISGITTAREAMRKMTEEDKQKIAQQVENFRLEKMTFDREVAKWDDAGNDIIVLAKHMCMIMMEMTDFTRGRGPLKTTMDVINAAKKISEAGINLDKLTRQIADQCPESSTKKDLLAYLQRIALYCHQLNITSKVKADVQNISGELIVSGLDSATSLIQAAKNLMNAVVLTVKASYVASTKYPRQGQVTSPIVVWKMKAPEKKPLVRPEKPEEVRAKVRKGSQKKVQNPIKALSEFQSPAESV
ncbi:hypothetical protein V9T40_004868 [Parthenolecanium corni]|uniref:Catenin alpha n=1 Tax=Parthenolecanium corni TaxID=536013 RepID=A0AAN9Y3H8_9HEMI